MTSFFGDLLATIAERGRILADRRQSPPADGNALELAEALLTEVGEASSVALAGRLHAAYRALDSGARLGFFLNLAEEFGPDLDAVHRAVTTFQDTPSPERAIELHEIAEPRRQELIRRLNGAPNGTLNLVRMREDLLEQLPENPSLAQVDHDFDHLLSSWFNRGFLVLEPITWATPAVILEKIIRYEAVHQIRSWNDLRRRIEPSDRRCYAFFHPALVDEPLIFVEVALTHDMAEAIAPILAKDRMPLSVQDAETAVFYSISNCQRGLRGISFGSFLIKQVVEELVRELPHLKTFVTLSPVPGFAHWLESICEDSAGSNLTDDDRTMLGNLKNMDWHTQPELAEKLQRLILPLAAHYFLNAKHPSGKPFDPVARFHLGNGARLERINWLGDPSTKALSQAAGLMVNYLYDLDHIEENHEAFECQDQVVTSRAIRRLAKSRNPLLALAQ